LQRLVICWVTDSC